MTVRELFHERYAPLHGLKDRTIQLYDYTIDRFMDFLGHEPELSDLDDLVVARFLKWRGVTPHRGRLATPASVMKDKVQLCAIWNYAAKKRLGNIEFPALPRNLVKAPKHVPVAYTLEQIAAMVREARKRPRLTGGKPSGWWWSTIVQAGFETGERLGGLLGLRWGEVDLPGRRVLFVADTRKGGTADISRPISARLAAEMATQQGRPGELVWHWDRAEKAIWTSLRILCERAHVPNHGFHGLRKSHASYVARAAGVDAAQAALAHQDARTTRAHYVDPTIAKPAEGLDVLPALPIEPPPTSYPKRANGRKARGRRPAA